MSMLGGGGARGARGSAQAKGPQDVVAVTEREFEAEVLRSELPVLIVFVAEWSAPSKQIAP